MNERRKFTPEFSRRDAFGKESLVLVEIEPREKREIVMVFRNDYPVERVCEVLGISRSSYYYQPKAADETALSHSDGFAKRGSQNSSGGMCHRRQPPAYSAIEAGRMGSWT